MADFSLRPFVRFFRFHRGIARFFGRWRPAFRIAASLGPFLHPGRQAHAHARQWPHSSWQRYLQTACIATALLYRIRDFPSLISMSWNDPEDVLATARQQGGLILTYHHPFAYHFPAFIGNQGITLDMLALSPTESPLYPLYEKHVARWFRDSETFFGGGKWIFLFRSASNDMRSPLRQLKNGNVVISLHDFPNFYEGAKSVPVSVLGHTFAAPEGIIGPAVKAGLPIAVGYTCWMGDNRLQINLRTLNRNGQEKLTSSEVLQRYFTVLEEVISVHPEFWESWGSLPTKDNS